MTTFTWGDRRELNPASMLSQSTLVTERIDHHKILTLNYQIISILSIPPRKEVLMSHETGKLLTLADQLDNLAIAELIKAAKKKEKKKLDPKAKVRNRGTVCVPAESAKDKKDHFPINDEGQARSALSRVEGLTSAPWYNGSLEGLKTLVKRKVHSKYPNIGKSDKTKKSSLFEVVDTLQAKYGQVGPAATTSISLPAGHNQAKGPDFFASQNAFWGPANNLIQLVASLGDAGLQNDLKSVLTDIVANATDVQSKAASGEFNPETTQEEMSKYLGNKPGSHLKMMMNKIEEKGEGAKALLTGRGGFDQFRVMMRQYMAQMFTIAGQMINDAVATATAKSGVGANPTPTSGMGQGQNGNVTTPAAAPGVGGTGGRRGDPEVAKIQTALRNAGLTGADGKPLDVDGVQGKNTNFAIQSYKVEHNMPQATDQVAKYYILHPGEAPGQRYATPGTPPAKASLEALLNKYS